MPSPNYDLQAARDLLVQPTTEMKAAGAAVGSQGFDLAHHTYATMIRAMPDAFLQRIIAAAADGNINQMRDAIGGGASHVCRRCHVPYTPRPGQSEDCPACGHDGSDPN